MKANNFLLVNSDLQTRTIPEPKTYPTTATMSVHWHGDLFHSGKKDISQAVKI